MATIGSVTHLIENLKADDSVAVQMLWNRYCARLIEAARKKLGRHPRRNADEDDAANSAFRSLCAGVKDGRFPRLDDRESLWRLMVFIVAQKVANQVAYERHKKRGGGKVRGHSAVEIKGIQHQADGFDQFAHDSLGPESLNQWAEQYAILLESLGDNTLKRIVELRLQNHTIGEIAKQLNTTRSTVDRKLRLIRETWQKTERLGS